MSTKQNNRICNTIAIPNLRIGLDHHRCCDIGGIIKMIYTDWNQAPVSNRKDPYLKFYCQMEFRSDVDLFAIQSMLFGETSLVLHLKNQDVLLMT